MFVIIEVIQIVLINDIETKFKWIVLIVELKTKKNIKSNSTVTQSQTQRTNNTPKINKNTKRNKKNDLKGGAPSDVRLSGKELIEQAFSDDSRECSTRFINLARKMVHNVQDSHFLNG